MAPAEEIFHQPGLLAEFPVVDHGVNLGVQGFEQGGLDELLPKLEGLVGAVEVEQRLHAPELVWTQPEGVRGLHGFEQAIGARLFR